MTVDRDEKTMRDTLIAYLSKKYESMPECPDKDKVLHLIRVNVRSIPYSELRIKLFEITGQM